MKTKFHILPLLFLLTGVFGNAQSLTNEQKEIYACEFLHWKISKDSVTLILKNHQDLVDNANAYDADFKNKELNHWLYYNEQNQLIKVKQRNTFAVNEAEAAKVFYKSLKKELISKYGKGKQTKKDEVIYLTWNLKYMTIQLEYDYKYKIIDEFGADSYWVQVEYKAN